MSMIKENPILFGCLGILAFLSLLACSGIVALYIMADEIVEVGMGKLGELSVEAGKGAGLKDPMTTLPALLTAGWGLSIHAEAGSPKVEFDLEPMEPRALDCAVLQTTLFPYLTGTMETVVVRSTSSVTDAGGVVTATPVECTWSGFPGSGGGLDAPLEPDDSAAADDDDSAIR